jgi:hypothetical protein
MSPYLSRDSRPRLHLQCAGAPHLHQSALSLAVFTNFIHTKPLRTHPFMRKITILGIDVSLPALGDILTGQNHSDVHAFRVTYAQASVILRLDRSLYGPPEPCRLQTLALFAWRAALRNEDVSGHTSTFPGLTKRIIVYAWAIGERVSKYTLKERVLDNLRATPTAEFWAIETRDLWALGRRTWEEGC